MVPVLEKLMRKTETKRHIQIVLGTGDLWHEGGRKGYLKVTPRAEGEELSRS